jgi:hypothetical protein
VHSFPETQFYLRRHLDLRLVIFKLATQPIPDTKRLLAVIIPGSRTRYTVGGSTKVICPMEFARVYASTFDSSSIKFVVMYVFFVNLVKVEIFRTPS